MDCCNAELRKTLLKLPEFHSKRQLLPFYAAYEYEEQSKQMIAFWQRALNCVFRDYLKKFTVAKQDLREVFTLKHFKPVSFDKILEELNAQGFIMNKEDHNRVKKALGLRFVQELPANKKVEPSLMSKLGS